MLRAKPGNRQDQQPLRAAKFLKVEWLQEQEILRRDCNSARYGPGEKYPIG